MKRHNLLLLIAILTVNSAIGADINLPAPSQSGGATLTEALATRRSCRQFDPSRPLTAQQLSDLLWAACGVNRPDEGKRTNPTALNKQEISVYVFSADGVTLYDPFANTLRPIADGDHRQLVAGQQSFVTNAPVSLVLVADVALFGDPANPHSSTMAAVDAGIVCENINLFCAANGLATVPRASMDTKAISLLLNLTPAQLPLMNNPVGYAR